MSLAVRSPWEVAADLLDPQPDPRRSEIEQDYEVWLQAMYPGYAKYPLADHHHAIWRWAWDLTIDSRPEAMVAIINRGGAKSTTAELAIVAMAARGARRYVLYICETQDQADDHVANIASMLEADTVEQYYPELGEKLVGKFGNSKGWRRNRLRTSSGFTVDALGLDTAGRGVKLDDIRPDAMVFDDLDGENDTARTTAKKIATITKKLMPAGGENVAVLAVQNLIHANSIFTKLWKGTADFLLRRKVVGPIPALRNFSFRQNPITKAGEQPTYTITSGEPTWSGFDVDRCEALLNLIGAQAFLTECQHEVFTVPGALGTEDELQSTRRYRAPKGWLRKVVSVDPAVTNTATSDETGIMVGGLGIDQHSYLIEDLSCRLHVDKWAERAVSAAVNHGASVILYEANQGQDSIASLLRNAMSRLGVRNITIKKVTASKTKFDRALALSEAIKTKTWHPIGSFPELEAQIKTITADHQGDSPDRLDSAVHLHKELTESGYAEIDVESHHGASIMGDIMDRPW